MKASLREYFSREKIQRLLKYALYMLLCLLAQNMLFTQIRPLGVCPLFLPAVAVAVGMFEGASFGSIFSLIMGIFADYAFRENTITFTLLFPALAFGAGFVSQFFINRRFFAYMGVAIVALLGTGVVQMLLTSARDEFSVAMIPTIILQALWALPLAVLVYFPTAEWIE